MDVAILATARERAGLRDEVRSAPTALAVRAMAVTDGMTMTGVKKVRPFSGGTRRLWL